MKKLFIFKVLVLVFITISCSKDDDLSQIEIQPPRHKIIGKWKSEFSKDGPNFVIEFQENNLLRVENNCYDCKGCSDCDDFYYYEIIDENSVEFDYGNDLLGKMIMTVSVIENNKLKTQCKNRDKPDIGYIIDAPLMCMGNWKFQRIH
jgi:hypothetical protein